MKTPQTAANLAIKALADSISADLLVSAHEAAEAQEAAQFGDLNMAVGCLLPVAQRLKSLQAQIDAVLALHGTK